MFPRIINIRNNGSFLLFGARGTGKSTLLKAHLPADQSYTFDLLDFDLETRLLAKPRLFSEILEGLPPQIRWVIVDEVQKLPFLLDEVHRQIESKADRHFALTGSSARKLKGGRANLLAGRAFAYHLYPLSTWELGDSFNLQQALQYGTLPKIFSLASDEDKADFLRTYAQTYLKEEIQMEGVVRDLTSFRRFLPITAAENGQILSWSNFARDTAVDAKTIRSYFEILEDTLIGFLLPAFTRSLRKRQKSHPKFYWFDTGVCRALTQQLSLPLLPGSSEYGRAFEHFWILEILRLNAYTKSDFTFSYFATHDVEIDLVVERPGQRPLWIEFKSSENVKDSELRALSTLSQELKHSEAICICREAQTRKVGNVWVLPWQEAMEKIFPNKKAP